MNRLPPAGRGRAVGRSSTKTAARAARNFMAAGRQRMGAVGGMAAFASQAKVRPSI